MPNEVPTPRLLLTAAEAAVALHISPRSLWSLTRSNAIPHLRLNRSVRYSLPALERWIAAKAAIADAEGRSA